MTTRSLSVLAVGLVTLLAIVAALQYQWTGELSRAELQRLRNGAQERAGDFARAFDREITRMFFSFGANPGRSKIGDWSDLAASYEQWRSAAPHPRLVKGLYGLAVHEGKVHSLVLRLGEMRLEEGPWPAELRPLHTRLENELTFASNIGVWERSRSFNPIDESGLAIAIPTVELARSLDPQAGWQISGSRLLGFTVVFLDVSYIRGVFVPVLERRYFRAAESFDYALRVFDSEVDETPLYVSEKAPLPASEPEISLRILGLSWEATNRDLLERAFPAREGDLRRLFDQEAAAQASSPRTRPGTLLRGRWRVGFWNRAGNLDEIVAAARRRNIALSSGVLVVLATSIGLLVLSAYRAQRLVRQQVEFVAGVTHELRTPVAVIRSAADNLADGLVCDTSQVRRYGLLLREEARRLTDMVEQVLELAGAQSPARAGLAPKPVDVKRLVEEALASCAPDLRHAGITPEKDVPDRLPPVLGDEAALQRAVRNLLDNAIKYSGEARWVAIRAREDRNVDGPAVHLSVEDHGMGIAADELPHIFEPFYRGQKATTRAIRGSGIGLSLVRRIVENHGGRITVDSGPERGTVFTMTLPATTPHAGGVEVQR